MTLWLRPEQKSLGINGSLIDNSIGTKVTLPRALNAALEPSWTFERI